MLACKLAPLKNHPRLFSSMAPQVFNFWLNKQCFRICLWTLKKRNRKKTLHSFIWACKFQLRTLLQYKRLISERLKIQYRPRVTRTLPLEMIQWRSINLTLIFWRSFRRQLIKYTLTRTTSTTREPKSSSGKMTKWELSPLPARTI